MKKAFEKYVEPFCDPPHLSKEQIETWCKLMKTAMEGRKWANPKCTKEMIVECDRKIRESRD